METGPDCLRRVLLGVITALVIAAAPATASAAVITVNTGSDTPANPATECMGVAGDCSLRQAIDKATSGVDTIEIPTSVPTITLTHGALTVSKNLTITGAGASSNTINGGLASGLFDISGLRNVTISGLTLTQGNAEFGAAIDTDGGNLTMTGDVVTGNLSGGSNTLGFGAVYDDDTGSSASSLTITGSSFSGNQVGGGGASGDGFGTVDFESSSGVGALTIRNATFTGNSSGGGGGDGFGTVNDEGTAGGASLTISGSTFADNTAGAGGGSSGFGGALEMTFSTAANVSISGSTFSSNSAGGDGASAINSGSGFGGAIDASYNGTGTFSLTGSTFSDNTAGGAGNAGTNSGSGEGAGLELDSTGNITATIAGDTFSGQRAGGSGSNGPNGGSGIGVAVALESFDSGTQITFLNDTITGNVGGGTPGTGTNSGSASGGGVFVEEGPATFVNDTIDGNTLSAATSSAGGGLEGEGATDTEVTVKNTIVAGNTLGGVTNDCGSRFSSAGHNLESATPDQCGFTTSGDLVDASPHLGQLANNGGPTLTQALEGGPAVNGGTNTGCPATDQRGVARPQGGVCDIGAYELAPPVAATGAAAHVQPTSATLTGTATNADVLGATVSFQYGTNTAYKSHTTAQSLAAGANGTAVSVPVSRLVPGTKYHYRIVVTSPDGTAAGADHTFITVAPKLSGLKLHNGTISYKDNVAATTTFTVLKAVAGYRHGSSCRAKRPAHGAVHGCTVYERVFGFQRKDKPGSNHSKLGRKLAAGTYRLIAVTKLDGKRSKQVQIGFKIH